LQLWKDGGWEANEISRENCESEIRGSLKFLLTMRWVR